MSTEADERVDLDVDLESEVPCAGDHFALAAWVGVTRPCKHAYAVCDFHRSVTEEWLTNRPDKCHCTTCRALVSSVTWRPL